MRRHAAHCARKANSVIEQDPRHDFFASNKAHCNWRGPIELAQAMTKDAIPNDNGAIMISECGLGS